VCLAVIVSRWVCTRRVFAAPSLPAPLLSQYFRQTAGECSRHRCNSNIFKCCSLRLKQRRRVMSMLRCSLAFLSRACVPQGTSARVFVSLCVCVRARTSAHTHAPGTHRCSYTTTHVTEYPRRVSNPHLSLDTEIVQSRAFAESEMGAP
jgi:hypothetical protein